MSRNLVYFVLLLCPALCMKLAGGQSGNANNVSLCARNATCQNNSLAMLEEGDVWFSLNGTIYQNNSIVTLEHIGEGDDALLCITDQRNCCTPAQIGMNVAYGNWFFPDGTRVPSSNSWWDIYRTRGTNVVRLNRRRGGEEGIYHCVILDTLNVTQTIYIGVYNTTGAPNVTELTFDRESRTLTCTSTGGPATTVTWTKDGAVITPNTTHQQTQMIVDSVEGIYQNTLTIAQSVTGDDLSGLYICMVENSRGSSNRTVYFYGDVWFSLNGTIYQNNSIVTLENIGEGDDALLCITDITDCCRPPYSDAIGNWFFPNGTRVPSSGNQWDIHRSRGQSVVLLHRRRGGEDGIYRCGIPVPQSDAEDVTQTIFIGVYTANTGAPDVTELTFDRESRTLTCTSTGGPATTFTWTKDGAVITPSTTHQQTQMIVDSVEGTYQNTLTIAQSGTGDNLYGLYSCMVENLRGSSNRSMYFYDSTCPVCISSISIPECTAATCPSFPGTDDVMSPQLIPSPSPQATSSPSPQAPSSPSPQVSSSPSSPGTDSPIATDSTTAPPTCSCSIEAIVITGVVAGVSGIAITLTVVVIVAVIKRWRTPYTLKDLNIRSHNSVYANINAIGMADCPAYEMTTQNQHQEDDYEYISPRPSASRQDEGHSLNDSQRDAHEN